MSDKKLIIMRGPSGAGKSFTVRGLLPHGDFDSIPLYEGADSPIVCSADEFFMNSKTREFDFDPTKLSEAHQWCFHRFLRRMLDDSKLIIVDNTNIHWWEFGNYVWAAAMHGYKIEIHAILPYTVKGLKICVDRQRHQVPMESVAKQTLSFEKVDPDNLPKTRDIKFVNRTVEECLSDQ